MAHHADGRCSGPIGRRNWLKVGRLAKDEWERNSAAKLTAHQELCIEFFDTYKKALAETIVECLKVIKNSKDWRAHAWLLERRCPEKWSRYRREYLCLQRSIKQLKKILAKMQRSKDANRPNRPTSPAAAADGDTSPRP